MDNITAVNQSSVNSDTSINAGNHSARANDFKNQKRQTVRNFMSFGMSDMPRDKKTSSRAGIKRQITLKSSVTQEFYFRAYAQTSNAHYFLEKVAPSVARRNSREDPTRIDKVRAFQKESTDNMDVIIKNIQESIERVRAKMEDNGIDPDSNAQAFTEPLAEDAIITSRMDSQMLTILEHADNLEGLIGISSVLGVFDEDEINAMGSALRRQVFAIYRTNTRNARTAMSAAAGKLRVSDKNGPRSESPESASTAGEMPVDGVDSTDAVESVAASSQRARGTRKLVADDGDAADAVEPAEVIGNGEAATDEAALTSQEV
ncbi:hypothetical protein [Acidithiobacillus ferridurans]|uniref:DUF1845 domain-containing protein n=1 Tax=Acidithiobacillus ferridurans TaxID=1232575 RepID=A0A8X8GC35_ACIFI|nr:hypothetical protein [Acidithiobacillus ferridurans]MBU2715100.1 hypothetical protein [Acidithiobacillus ferridurans]MBU2723897.1 hypothetical protein [Acidithiobacillus ferridurans]MBU2727958.1 hypothetical protein [Acidithiobacillus ferridurans]